MGLALSMPSKRDPQNSEATHRSDSYTAQSMNTSFMQLTTVVQAFENAVLCADDGGESWGRIDEAVEEE